MVIRKLPNYIKRFGIGSGLRLYHQIEQPRLRKHSTTVRGYQVPGYAAPLYLRRALSDHAIFWQCIVKEQYDTSFFAQNERFMQLYNKTSKPLIIDCGGNIGLAAIYLAQRFPKAIIVTVEPSYENIGMIKKNLACFGSRITILHGAVWHHPTTLQIKNPDAGYAAYEVEPGIGVRAYTIREICEIAGAARPLVVKIDIEGAQKSLFSSNTGWVGETDLIMIELDDWRMPWQGTSRAFFSCLSRYPFDYLIRGEALFCFRDCTGN